MSTITYYHNRDAEFLTYLKLTMDMRIHLSQSCLRCYLDLKGEIHFSKPSKTSYCIKCPFQMLELEPTLPTKIYFKI